MSQAGSQGEGGRGDHVVTSYHDLHLGEPSHRVCVAVHPSGLGEARERIFSSLVKRVRHILRALRLDHWSKNLLLFVPLVMAHELGKVGLLLDAALASLCFCLFASAGYIFNDLLDLEADRLHPRKARRPFASNDLAMSTGPTLIVGLIVAGFLLSLVRLPHVFTLMLGGYLLLSFSYSIYFKKKLLIDVIMLAGFYTYRVLAGSAAVNVPVTTWLLVFSMFIFLSLAFAKRYNELMLLQSHHIQEVKGRAYRVNEMDLLLSVGPTTGCLSVLVLALYISESPEVDRLYRSVALLWSLCPLLLYWILRIWFMARRGELTGDPVAFALTDKNSIVVGAFVLALLFVASRWAIIS